MSLPFSAHDLALFIAYLAKSKYSASTVFTYISSISYVHRLGSFPDPTQSSTVKLALKGHSKLNPSVADSRLPITLPLLERIVTAFSSTVSGDYHRKLMSAMYTMRFFKHSNPTQPVDILLHKSQPICPVTTIAEYLSVRGQISGPLFCWPDNSPVRRLQFLSALNQALTFCGLETDRYKTHSFRIGAASWAAAQGFSDSQIRRFGRWKSNTFLKYIRTPSL